MNTLLRQTLLYHRLEPLASNGSNSAFTDKMSYHAYARTPSINTNCFNA